MTNVAVFGIYQSYVNVDDAVARLRTAGFRSTDISLLVPENLGNSAFAHIKTTKLAETSSVVAASSGAALGGGLGWLVGVGVLSLAGIGPLLAAGPIVGALAGGVAGALIGMGIPEYEAKRCEGRVRQGGILLSLHATDAKSRETGKKVLEQTGAQHVADARELKGDYVRRPLAS